MYIHTLSLLPTPNKGIKYYYIYKHKTVKFYYDV